MDQISAQINTPCIGNPHQAATLDHERFIARHRLALLRYLDGSAPASAGQPDALGYVDAVLTEWHELFYGSELADPSPEERTFWFTLYQLEELVELPGPHIEPYEQFLMENLVDARELLRHGKPLPEHRFMATRPDGA